MLLRVGGWWLAWKKEKEKKGRRIRDGMEMVEVMVIGGGKLGISSLWVGVHLGD